MINIETVDDIVEEIANMLHIYNSDEKPMARLEFKISLRKRIYNAVTNEELLSDIVDKLKI